MPAAAAISPSVEPKPVYRAGMQAIGMILFWWLAQCLTAHFHWPIPGSLLGLMLLWGLLELGLLKLHWIEQGADSLLRHLMLFFVPAMLALVDHHELFSLLGIKLILVVLISTVVVMCGTACIVEIGFRLSHARSR
ncbi:CidA/LrgA family protein [Luteolibacter pohnpeiensis]|uniref:CidA/LrgA family protein n=1 Tax=Luteolibacter pohnpeiensis TaxID=454153 RepID=A0A934VXZ9_9BACT|nr:CidA/LrgA family protein [Luteolibacter pohnpeiensis]MBK1884378.1 CidA/LrgA family protein [Luteolibacter pohnpeiensis]